MPIKPKLRPYQREGIIHTINQPFAGLFYDPGLGKTLTTLLSFELLRMRERLQRPRMLVVAPLLVAQSVWAQEAQKWTHTSHLTTLLLWARTRKGKEALLPGIHTHDITVINYEGLKWLEENLPRDEWPWDVLVLDELSKCKDSTTQRAKILNRIRNHFTRIWGLTGTPAPNSCMELFGQIKVLDGGASLGKSLWTFRQTHFYQKPYDKYKWYLRPGHDDIIADKIAHLVHRLKARDHLDMPDLIDIWHKVPVSRKDMNTYLELEKESYLQLSTQTEASAVSAGVLWGKLQQVCQGFLYEDQDIPTPQKPVHRINEAKLDVLEDIIEEAAGQPVLVFYKFHADLEALRGRFHGRGNVPLGVCTKDMPTEELVQRWNNKEIQVLLANPQSASHGLNIQEGGNIMVWYCLDSSNERDLQSKGRLERQGQEAATVINHHLEIPGTVDSDIKDVLEGRATMQERLLSKWAQYVPSERAKA